MSTPNYIMPERQEYSLFDINLKGKIVRRNAVDYAPTGTIAMTDEERIERTDMHLSGPMVPSSVLIFPSYNQIIGKLTGRYRFEYPYFQYELELFCHAWNDRGQAIYFVNLRLNTGSALPALKYFQLLEDTGTLTGVVWRDHNARSPISGTRDLFPHFDPDYKLYSDPEKWDKYFHVTPADWTGVNAIVPTEYDVYRRTREFISYNYTPFIERRCSQTDNSHFKTATQTYIYLYFPVVKGVPVDKGACAAIGNPDINSILSLPLEESHTHDYKPEYLHISGLTPGATYNIKTWVKYLDENDVEQIVYSEAVQVPMLTTLTYPRLTGSNARWLSNNYCNFNMGFSIVGDYEVEEAGLCYAIGHIPTMADTKLPVTVRNFFEIETVHLNSLTPGTTYKVRSYVKTTNGEVRYYNVGGIGLNDYWNDYPVLYEFTTLGALVTKPTVQIVSVSDKTYNSVTLKGRITNLGNANATASGFVWNYTGMPTTADNLVNGDVDTRNQQTDIFYAGLAGLQSGKNVFIRAFATNSAGTGYSEQLVIETLVEPTVAQKVTLISITGITAKSAIVRASVNANAGTERGICVSSTNTNPTIADTKVTAGSGIGDFEIKLNDLISLKMYYVRAYNTVAGVTTYSDPMSFTTLKNITLPTLTALNYAKNSKETALTASFDITNDGGESPQNFIYLGNVMPTTTIPANAIEKTIGAGTKTHTFDMTGLTGNQYLAAYSRNTAGTVVSSVLTVALKAKTTAQITTTVTRINRTKAQLSATVLNFGGSEASDWHIALFENEILTVDYEAEFDEVTGAFSKVVDLVENRDYRFEFTFATTYMEASSIAAVVSSAEFDTNTEIIEDNVTVVLTKNSNTGNKVNLTANYTGTSTSAIASISIVGDQSKAPIYPLGNAVYYPSIIAPFTKEVALPNVGLWYLRAIVTTVTGKMFLSPVIQVTVSSMDDPNTNPNVENGTEIFSPYQNGNYNGRKYYFGDRRWIYNAIDAAWRLDYSYKKEAVQAQIAVPSIAVARAVLSNDEKSETNTYTTSLKLDRIPKVGEKIDGFEVVKVFYSDDSDIDLFGSGDVLGIVLVKFDSIEWCNYARAKEIADSLSAELLPISKYPFLINVIREKQGIEIGEIMWGDAEDADESICYRINEDQQREYLWLDKSESAIAIPCRILVMDKYLTKYYHKYSEDAVNFSHANQTSKMFIGDVTNVRVSLMRNENYVIVASVDITLGGYGRALTVSDTVGNSKIEYTVKFEYRDNVMTEPGYLMWIDSISLSGALNLSEDDYELIVSEI